MQVIFRKRGSVRVFNLETFSFIIKEFLCFVIDHSHIQERNKTPHPKQVKAVRKTGISLLLHLCSAPGIDLDSFWVKERVSCVQTEVLANHPLTTSAIASPGHIVLRLASVWSQSGSEYLAKAFFTPELLSELIELLQRKNLSKAVAKMIVEVVSNLVFSEGIIFWPALQESSVRRNLNQHSFLDVQNTGRRLLGPYHSGLIEYLYNRFLTLKSLSTSQARKTISSTGSEWLQREFRLLGYLTVSVNLRS